MRKSRVDDEALRKQVQDSEEWPFKREIFKKLEYFRYTDEEKRLEDEFQKRVKNYEPSTMAELEIKFFEEEVKFAKEKLLRNQIAEDMAACRDRTNFRVVPDKDAPQGYGIFRDENSKKVWIEHREKELQKAHGLKVEHLEKEIQKAQEDLQKAQERLKEEQVQERLTAWPRLTEEWPLKREHKSIYNRNENEELLEKEFQEKVQHFEKENLTSDEFQRMRDAEEMAKEVQAETLANLPRGYFYGFCDDNDFDNYLNRVSDEFVENSYYDAMAEEDELRKQGFISAKDIDESLREQAQDSQVPDVTLGEPAEQALDRTSFDALADEADQREQVSMTSEEQASIDDDERQKARM